MNSKPIFHIFGVPDGFDILNGTPDITPYFQRYYNGSEENTKYSIHRDSNGNITYAYLKYNLSSYQSRTGSFFGMSLTFSNEYCTDPVKLYELLDFVYVNKVLGSSAEKGLLQKIEVESKIQARYLIPNFGSAKDYIQQEIEFVLLNNITKLFANSFQPISVLFKNDQSHLVAQIPFADANNEKIISLLHTYNRIAISPDWEPEPTIIDGGSTTSPEPKIVIAPETIKFYDEYVKNYQSYLIESLANVKAANINDARQGQAEIESVLKNLQSGTSTDQRLPQLISDYKALSGQFAELIQKIADEQNRRPTPPPRKPGSSTKHPIPWWKQYLPYISGVAVLVIFVVVLSNIFDKEDTRMTNPLQTVTLPTNYMDLAREALYKEDFEGALKQLKNEDNYRQYDLYDTIYAQRIASLLKDKDWNEAWQVAEDIEKTKLKEEKQSEIRNKCEKYFTDKVSKAKKANAQEILDKINGLKFKYNKRNEHINTLKDKLNPPQNTNTGGTGNTSSTMVTPSTNDNQKYEIWIYQLPRAGSTPEQRKAKTRFQEGECEFSVTTLPATVAFYIAPENNGPIDENKQKFFETDLRVSGPSMGWYTISFDENNINKSFVFKGPGNTIRITFKYNQ